MMCIVGFVRFRACLEKKKKVGEEKNQNEKYALPLYAKKKKKKVEEKIAFSRAFFCDAILGDNCSVFGFHPIFSSKSSYNSLLFSS